jgi:uncharacterized protein YbbC (DUF1343 family)
MRSILISLLLFYFLNLYSCSNQTNNEKEVENKEILVGALQFNSYVNLLKNKAVGIVSNQTSIVQSTHLVDTLLSLEINIKKVFAPEHGFRGEAEAGETVNNSVDSKTGIPIISIYGNNYKPKSEDLKGIDIMVFDIQDVGVRFFTYISTLHYVMESCAENNIPLIVLDRPNPNGFYIDGPIMEKEHTSFVGMHPVPIVYGMTIGEYAKMINGEGWLNNKIECDLSVIPCENYTHESFYELPIKPSPNLPTMRGVYLYPSTGLFEGTVVNEGRGTHSPFEVFGHPDFEGGNYSYIPKSIPGMSRYPKLKGEECFGMDLRDISIEYLRNKIQIQLEWIILAYKSTKVDAFFIPFFENLTGTKNLRNQIENGVESNEIRKSWENDLQKFKAMREKYLIYE